MTHGTDGEEIVAVALAASLAQLEKLARQLARGRDDDVVLAQMLNNQLQSIHGVVATETLISLEQSIKREIPVKTDETDN